MADKFFVRIDLARLRHRLGSVEPRRRMISHGDAFAWLQQQGFAVTRGGWHVRQQDLGLLAVDEILLRQRIA